MTHINIYLHVHDIITGLLSFEFLSPFHFIRCGEAQEKEEEGASVKVINSQSKHIE